MSSLWSRCLSPLCGWLPRVADSSSCRPRQNAAAALRLARIRGLCPASTNEGAVARQKRCSGARSPQEMAAAETGQRRNRPPQEPASDDIETQRQLVRYVVTAKLHNACLNPDRHRLWGRHTDSPQGGTSRADSNSGGPARAALTARERFEHSRDLRAAPPNRGFACLTHPAASRPA